MGLAYAYELLHIDHICIIHRREGDYGLVSIIVFAYSGNEEYNFIW